MLQLGKVQLLGDEMMRLGVDICGLSGGQKQLHIWNPRPRFAYSLYNFYWATTTMKNRDEEHNDIVTRSTATPQKA